MRERSLGRCGSSRRCSFPGDRVKCHLSSFWVVQPGPCSDPEVSFFVFFRRERDEATAVNASDACIARIRSARARILGCIEMYLIIVELERQGMQNFASSGRKNLHKIADSSIESSSDVCQVVWLLKSTSRLENCIEVPEQVFNIMS